MKFKILVVSVFFICSVLPGISLAQSKVVVIPLLSDKGNEIPTVTSATGRVWMDRNLGAYRVAQSMDDYQAYGWLYQWGRLADGHEVRGSEITSTNSAVNVPGHDNFITELDSPYDWRIPQNVNLWQGVSGDNNPCPAGFRLPTAWEWEIEVASWDSDDAAGAYASPLKLVLAGSRIYTDGLVYNEGINGQYWSSTVFDIYARFMYFNSAPAHVGTQRRAEGLSVRCIKD